MNKLKEYNSHYQFVGIKSKIKYFILDILLQTSGRPYLY